MHGKCKISRP